MASGSNPLSAGNLSYEVFEFLNSNISTVCEMNDADLPVERARKAVDICSEFLNASDREGPPFLPDVSQALGEIRKIISLEEGFDDPINLTDAKHAFNKMRPSLFKAIVKLKHRSFITSRLMIISKNLLLHYNVFDDSQSMIKAIYLREIYRDIIEGISKEFPELPSEEVNKR